MSCRIAWVAVLALMATHPTWGNGRDVAHAQQVEQARQLRQSYLDRGFIAELPKREGRALNVSGERRSRFAASTPPRISGELRIGRLEGLMHLSLARTREVLYYGQVARVKGTAMVDSGRLRIYSRVDVDPWTLARALVKTPSSAPPPEDFRLDGWTATEVAPGQPVAFSAQLVSSGGDFLLMLEAPDGQAEGIRLVLDAP